MRKARMLILFLLVLVIAIAMALTLKPPKTAETVGATCPVMGTYIPDVSKSFGQSEYKGETYYFCCPGCKPEFDKDPSKYVE